MIDNSWKTFIWYQRLSLEISVLQNGLIAALVMNPSQSKEKIMRAQRLEMNALIMKIR